MPFWRCVSEKGETEEKATFKMIIFAAFLLFSTFLKMWAEEFKHILVLYSIFNKWKASDIR